MFVEIVGKKLSKCTAFKLAVTSSLFVNLHVIVQLNLDVTVQMSALIGHGTCEVCSLLTVYVRVE